MSLPMAWIDRIFDKLTLTYGQAFLARWRDVDMDAVRADWAHELSGFQQHPQAIAWGLQNLPDAKPPTVLEFRSLCRKTPAEVVPQLPAPKADPARVAAELARLAPMRTAPPVDHQAWARRILANFEAGGRVAPCTLRFAREALMPRAVVRALEGAE